MSSYKSKTWYSTTLAASNEGFGFVPKVPYSRRRLRKPPESFEPQKIFRFRER